MLATSYKMSQQPERRTPSRQAKWGRKPRYKNTNDGNLQVRSHEINYDTMLKAGTLQLAEKRLQLT
jgi:hypothetical protein